MPEPPDTPPSSPKTVAVTPAVHAYLVAHGTPPDAVASSLIDETGALGSVARMQSAPEQGAFRTMLVRRPNGSMFALGRDARSNKVVERAPRAFTTAPGLPARSSTDVVRPPRASMVARPRPAASNNWVVIRPSASVVRTG